MNDASSSFSSSYVHPAAFIAPCTASAVSVSAAPSKVIATNTSSHAHHPPPPRHCHRASHREDSHRSLDASQCGATATTGKGIPSGAGAAHHAVRVKGHSDLDLRRVELARGAGTGGAGTSSANTTNTCGRDGGTT